jgi:predicted DNA-binding transcriptional regulator YafY
MDRTERFYRIQQMLRQSRVVPVRTFLRELEVSLATFKRDLEYMRSRLNTPIVWDRELNGYRYDKAAPVQELPGLWFSDSEIYALLTMQRLLESLEPGLLGPHVAPLLERLKAAIGSGAHSAAEVHQRIRILHLAKRTLPPQYFQLAAAAVLPAQAPAHQVLQSCPQRADRAGGLASAPGALSGELVSRAWCHLREGFAASRRCHPWR